MQTNFRAFIKKIANSKVMQDFCLSLIFFFIALKLLFLIFFIPEIIELIINPAYAKNYPFGTEQGYRYYSLEIYLSFLFMDVFITIYSVLFSVTLLVLRQRILSFLFLVITIIPYIFLAYYNGVYIS
jgi:hypothetical protein